MLNKKAMTSLVKYDFGNQTNDAPLIFAQFLGQRKDKIFYWQVVHLKSAVHEGWLAYKILTEREKQGLPIHARHFFSVYSPLERFFPKNFIYNKPIFNHQDYCSHYCDLLEIFEDVVNKLTANSNEYFSVLKTISLLKLQLYGFARAALQHGKIKLAIFAFTLAKVLDKKAVQEIMSNYQQPAASTQYLKL